MIRAYLPEPFYFDVINDLSLVTGIDSFPEPGIRTLPSASRELTISPWVWMPFPQEVSSKPGPAL